MFGGRRSTGLVVCVVVLLGSAACSTSRAGDAAEPPTTTTPPRPSTTTEPPTTTTTEPPPPPTWGVGSEGDVVLHVQQRLTVLGYRPGEVDGHYGSATASAVLAYQKHEGLQRDGVTGPQVLAAIDAPQIGAGPGGGAGLEIDLDRQIMFVVSL